jgi:hypothetical protein
VSKQTSGGTAWETELVDTALSMGFMADRYPKRGQPDEPDLWWINPHGWWETNNTHHHVLAVAWKRLVKNEEGKRRRPDGERAVVTITLEDFAYLVYETQTRGLYPLTVDIQAKACQNLNVTRTLKGLKEWTKKRAASMRGSSNVPA